MYIRRERFIKTRCFIIIILWPQMPFFSFFLPSFSVPPSFLGNYRELLTIHEVTLGNYLELLTIHKVTLGNY